MNIIAPCPKKPTSLLQQDWNSSRYVQHQQQQQQQQQQDDMVDDACFELRQILQNQGHYRHYCTTTVTANEVAAATARLDEPLIPRTNNPLPLDSSFVPLHQNPSVCPSVQHRPRSLSVGDSRPVMNLVH